MASYFTTDTLISDVKRRAMLPDSESTFRTVDFLAFANSELKVGVLPVVMSLQEEFYVYSETTTLVANKSFYEIPYRAIGGKLRDLFYQDTQGNLVEMTRISPDDKVLYQESAVDHSFIFYYIQGNSVVLVPNVNSNPSGSLIFTYFIRPSELVEESRVAIITGISTNTLLGTTTYTVDGVPTGMTVSSELDLLQARPGHKIRRIDLTPTAINTVAATITFNTSDIDSETEVGDHIAFSGECIIPQCPTDLQPMLSQRIASRCLEALGDTQGLTNANTKLQEMEIKSAVLVDNRVVGSPQKVVNHKGLLRSSKIRRRW